MSEAGKELGATEMVVLNVPITINGKTFSEELTVESEFVQGDPNKKISEEILSGSPDLSDFEKGILTRGGKVFTHDDGKLLIIHSPKSRKFVEEINNNLRC